MNSNFDVKEMRKALNMTQKAFADYCGVTERTVQKWEAGANVPVLVSKYYKYVEAENNSGISNTGAQSIMGDGIVGNNINDNSALLKAMDEIDKMREALTDALACNQKHTDRLLSLIEKMQS
jgi:transcriptional regulator with XRE-family HTH domain